MTRLSISDLTVQSFHLVVIMLARKRDLSNVNGAVNLLVGSELFEPCVLIGPQTISYENLGFLPVLSLAIWNRCLASCVSFVSATS